MNAYNKIIAHIAKYAYKRGAHIGDAPADCGDRGKSHFRMVNIGNNVCTVRFYRTDIITAYADGDIELHSGGWSLSPTTRAAFSEALFTIGMRHLVSGPSSTTFRSTSHNVVNTIGKTYVYYDGMRFNQMGELLTPPQAFEETRIDKVETGRLAVDLKVSGFKDMYKIIYATCQPPTDHGLYFGKTELRDKLTDPDRACDWPDIVSSFKYSKEYDYSLRAARWDENSTAGKTWSAIMTDLKRSMYTTKPTDVLFIG